MQRILNLIEATLDAEVTPAELAAQSGYSLWHFLHLFQQEVGMPLCRYRTQRRLAHAIWAISRGMGVTDAALRWGFGSHSGFYRAFQREYAMSPTAYLRENRVHAPHVLLLKKEETRMLTKACFQEALSHWADAAALPLIPVLHPDSGQKSESAMYAGADYILKAYRDRRSAELAAALAEALHAQGIPSARAVPLADGSLVLPLYGGGLSLCRRLPGTALRSGELIRQPRAGQRIGEALAGLHLATAVLMGEADADDEPYADQLLSWAYPASEDVLPAAFPADYARRVERFRCLPAALIHRDPNPANLINTGDGIGFIDFDLSRRGARIFDPCYLLTAVLSEVFERAELPWQENWPTLCEAVLAGYDRVSPLTEVERAAIPDMLLGNELLCIAAFRDSGKYRAVYETNLRMLPYLLTHLPRC